MISFYFSLDFTLCFVVKLRSMIPTMSSSAANADSDVQATNEFAQNAVAPTFSPLYQQIKGLITRVCKVVNGSRVS